MWGMGPVWHDSQVLVQCDNSGSGQFGLQQSAGDHALTTLPVFFFYPSPVYYLLASSVHPWGG